MSTNPTPTAFILTDRYYYTMLDDHEGLDGGPRYEINDAENFTVCIVDDEAEARLFCAAPELLAALGSLIAQIDRLQGESSCIDEDIMQGEAYRNALSARTKATRSPA